MNGLNRSRHNLFTHAINHAYQSLLKGRERRFRTNLRVCTGIFQEVMQEGNIAELLEMHKESAIAMLEYAREHVSIGPREGALLLVNSVIETHNNNQDHEYLTAKYVTPYERMTRNRPVFKNDLDMAANIRTLSRIYGVLGQGEASLEESNYFRAQIQSLKLIGRRNNEMIKERLGLNVKDRSTRERSGFER